MGRTSPAVALLAVGLQHSVYVRETEQKLCVFCQTIPAAICGGATSNAIVLIDVSHSYTQLSFASIHQRFRLVLLGLQKSDGITELCTPKSRD